DDFIEALVRGLNLDNIIHPINVGQQKGYSISESAKLIKEEMGFDGEIVFNTNYQDGAPIKIMSRQKFDALFASFEWFDHRKGIANTIRYYEGVL
ncbi:MAG TPA: GDP-L-fucose synthetase, partial [Flavobacteriaceae bacterium]|nr:GDP-L-fucose synthetase [Flavobacteriaceae bacterium]